LTNYCLKVFRKRFVFPGWTELDIAHADFFQGGRLPTCRRPCHSNYISWLQR